MTGITLLLAALVLFTAWAAYVDWRTGHIPNRLVLFGMAGGVLLRAAVALLEPVAGLSTAAALGRAVGGALLGAVGCALVPLLLFRLNAMGGGDVKLLAALGAATGLRLGLEVELTAFVLVALYAPARMAYEGRLLRLLGNSVALLVNPLLPKSRRRDVPEALLTSLPFGPAVFLASLLVAVSRLWGAG